MQVWSIQIYLSGGAIRRGNNDKETPYLVTFERFYAITSGVLLNLRQGVIFKVQEKGMLGGSYVLSLRGCSSKQTTTEQYFLAEMFIRSLCSYNRKLLKMPTWTSFSFSV